MPPPSPFVSVVIPSFNHARYLTDAIESVLTQRRAELELIIVDDGSTDDSWDLIKKASEADGRVVALRQENQGAHAAINRGLAAARGDYLAILNSDDIYEGERIAALLDRARTGAGKDFLFTSVTLIDSEGAPVKDHPWLDEYTALCVKARDFGVLQALLERNLSVSTSNFFFSRSLYDAIGGFRPFRYTMDWDYALRAVLRAQERVDWLPDQALLRYRLHGRNTILGGLPRSALEANHLLYRTLRDHYQVPPATTHALRRHHRLIRRQQAATLARARDTHWEGLLNDTRQRWEKAEHGWRATRQEADETHAKLGAAITELSRLRASRSYRLGRLITMPLRRIRSLAKRVQKRVDSAVRLTETVHEDWYRSVSLPLALKSEPPTIAVHLHIHFVEPLEELLDTLGGLGVSFDLFVTTTDPSGCVRQSVHARFPQATVLQLPNKGKDIGPFLQVLEQERLDRYDLVLKLHGKRSRNDPEYMDVVRTLFGNDIVDGDDWRRKLIAPIAGTPVRVARILQAFAEDPKLGMLGAEKFICSAPDANSDPYTELCDCLGVAPECRFFGGTMFWIRGKLLQRLHEAKITQSDFDADQAQAVEGTLEHAFERVFGDLVIGQGCYIGGVPDLPEEHSGSNK